MSDFQHALEETKRQIEDIRKPIRTKATIVWWCGITGMVLFCFYFAFVMRLHWPFLVFAIAFPVFVLFRFKKDLRRYFYLYENELAALETTPETADDYSVRARILSDWVFPEAAVADYRKALEIDPGNDMFRYELAITLWLQMKDGEAALPYFEQLAQSEGDNQADALMYRGQILAKSDPEAALASFEKAVEIEPDDSDYHLARLRFYLETNRIDAAEAAMAETVKVIKKEKIPEPAEFFELQGLLAMRRSNPALAVKHWTKAIQRLPEEESYYRLRSEAYDALNDFSRANADREKAELLEKG